MKRSLAFFMAALVSFSLWAQKQVVSGTVVSSATGEALTGASVTAEGVAVVTNGDGFFTLKTDGMQKAITVSSLGYQSSKIQVEGQSQGLKIKLKPITIQLNEVFVMAADPRDLVEAAIKAVPQNYSRQPELYNCFYRETAMKRQHYVYVAEGVVDMYKTSYTKTTASDRVAIRKGRRLLSPKQGDTLGIKVIGGPVTSVILDLVKNTDFLLNTEELDNYDMKMETPISINNRMQYVVAISPRCNMPYALYFGKLYIDQETLAFTRAELSLDMTDHEKATRLMLVKKPFGVRFKPKEMSLLVDYRYVDGVMHQSYIRTTFRFNCDWKRRLFSTPFTAFCEMVVTSKSDNAILPIRGRDSFDRRDAFFDKVDYFLDPVFWQDYNIIEPTESLDRAIDKLLRKHQIQVK